jgi:hypothetical protein
VLVTLHAIATHAAVFVLLGSLQIVAITTIVVFATKYRWSSCAGHLPVNSVIETEPRGLWPRGDMGGDATTQEHEGSGALERLQAQSLELSEPRGKMLLTQLLPK